MNIKGKRLFVDLTFFSPNGNVLDISNDNTGIIYNITKHNNDLVDIDDCKLSEEIFYDSCAIFFVCSMISKLELETMFNDINKVLKENGEIYIWDRVKEKGEIVRDDIHALLPNKTTKNFKYINLNPFTEFKLDNIEKILEKNFYIAETIIWDRIMYLKLNKKGTKKDENIISRNKLEIYT
ncbi:hypothetical protein [Clostridium sp.]|uniref:hypothetical protein n=1 Tax=Clostridium sp. TaxID=1506 RepID=UPI00399406FC